jgi:hypothetical protein
MPIDASKQAAVEPRVVHADVTRTRTVDADAGEPEELTDERLGAAPTPAHGAHPS